MAYTFLAQTGDELEIKFCCVELGTPLRSLGGKLDPKSAHVYLINAEEKYLRICRVKYKFKYI